MSCFTNQSTVIKILYMPIAKGNIISFNRLPKSQRSMTVAYSSQELVQKDPRGESEALRQPEEAALGGLTGDSTSHDL